MTFLSNITRIKTEEMINAEIAEEQKGGDGLHKSLSAMAAILFGAANVIGVGIFVVASKASIVNTGPSVILAFILSAITCAISGICYARFASRISSSGSSYTYVYSTMGEIFAFFAGLGASCESSISSAFLARACSKLFKTAALGIEKRSAWTIPIVDQYIEIDWIAPIITILITSLCLIGAKESTRLSTTITIINTIMILTCIVAGMTSSSFATKNLYDPVFFTCGVAGLMRATRRTFLCYCGWDSVCTLSEEVKEPKKDIPRAIFGCLALVGCLYCGVAVALCGMKSIDELKQMSADIMHKADASTNSGSGVDNMTDQMLVDYAPYLHDVLRSSSSTFAHSVGMGLTWGIVLTSFTAALASAQSQPRVWFRMAKDGLLPKSFGYVNRAGNLSKGVLYSGIFSTLLALFITDDNIEDIIVSGVLLMQSFVCISCLLHDVQTNFGEQKKAIIVKLTLLLSVVSTAMGMLLQVTNDTNTATVWSCLYSCFAASVCIGMVMLFVLGKGYSVAIVPIIAIILNFFYMGSSGLVKVTAFFAVYAVLSLWYFSYGYKYSKLATAKKQDIESEITISESNTDEIQ